MAKKKILAWAVFRKRPDENKGKEFFYYAHWHRDTILGEGERYVRVKIVPLHTRKKGGRKK